MATLKIKKNRLNAEGEYDQIHYETDASAVLMEDGFTTAQDAIDNKMNKTNPTGTGSFSLNRKVNTEIGLNSFAEGDSTEASGYASHAEGERTTASGGDSHAEGYDTVTRAWDSHTEGAYTIADAYCGHAEGYSTVAGGYESHAEGCGCYDSIYLTGDAGATTYTVTWFEEPIAVGQLVWGNDGPRTIIAFDSEAYTITLDGTLDADNALNDEYCSLMYTGAFGDYSHAEGYSTIAAGESQHVQGEWNIKDDEGTYAHIVGNGTDSGSYRSNAHTLDWSGNAWFAGDVYVGSTSGTNKDDGSKKLATVDEVAAKANASHTQSAGTITAGTFAGQVVAANDTNYTTYQVRNVAILSATPSSMTNGQIAFVYS